jgi:predicted cupin superfamily sugar epimerase
MQAHDIIRDLALAPHPEGGWYRELYRSPRQVTTAQGSRCALTTIYYLLERHSLSRWHSVAADEIWHFYAGAPLELFAYDSTAGTLVKHLLCAPAGPGAAGAMGEPVAVIPSGVWQAARSLGDYSLLGCSVAPGFEFADFRFVVTLPEHATHFTGTLQHLRELL